jgi:hypothetical protein
LFRKKKIKYIFYAFSPSSSSFLIVFKAHFVVLWVQYLYCSLLLNFRFPSSSMAAFMYYLSQHRNFLFLATMLLKVQGWKCGHVLALWCDSMCVLIKFEL